MFLVKYQKIFLNLTHTASVLRRTSFQSLSFSKLSFYDFSNQLDDGGRDSDCSVILQTLFHRISNEYYSDLSLIEKAKSVLHQSGQLNDLNAEAILPLCGKQLCANNNVKLDLAHSIFELAEPKTIKIVNDLLQVYLENGYDFDCQMVLARIAKLNLVPDKDTFLKLIAKNCLKGKIANAYQIYLLLLEKELVIPLETYGYFAFALCKAGHPKYAMQLIDKLVHSSGSLSWDIFTLLFCGLASSPKKNWLANALNKYHSNFKDDMSIFHLLKMYETFEPSLISKVIPYKDIQKNDIVMASHHMRRSSQQPAASFLKQLLMHCDNRMDASNLIVPFKRILGYYIKNGSFDELWDAVLVIQKPIIKNPSCVYYLTLALIMEVNPSYLDMFMEKMADINVDLDIPFPQQVVSVLRLSPKHLNILQNLEGLVGKEKHSKIKMNS